MEEPAKEDDPNDVELVPDVEEKPKTAKDLFTDFKPTPVNSDQEVLSEHEVEIEVEEVDENDEDYLPSRRGRKKSSPASANRHSEPPPKKRVYTQKYRKEWESVANYRNWISESVLGNLYFYCKFCKNDNRCGKTELDKHMVSIKHVRNSKVPQLPKFRFREMVCSVFTPFAYDREINYSLIVRYAKYLKSHKVAGILINDRIGEGMSLTCAERMRVTEEWVRACAITGQHLMVQVGGRSFKDIQEMVRHAEKHRVGSLVVLPDLYNKPKDHYDLMRYLKVISDTANTLPIIYHHYPQYTGVDIDMTRFLNDVIGEIDTIVGIIHSGNDLQAALSACRVNEDKFAVFIGTDELMLGSICCGFPSIVSASMNFAPDVIAAVQEATSKTDMVEARVHQKELNSILGTIYTYGEGIPALKAAMNILSPIDVGSVREPLVAVWQDKINKMKFDLVQLKGDT